MPTDLPPNLNQVATPIVRAAERMPQNPNSQAERNRKDEVKDAGNRNAAEKNRAGEQRPR